MQRGLVFALPSKNPSDGPGHLWALTFSEYGPQVSSWIHTWVILGDRLLRVLFHSPVNLSCPLDWSDLLTDHSSGLERALKTACTSLLSFSLSLSSSQFCSSNNPLFLLCINSGIGEPKQKIQNKERKKRAQWARCSLNCDSAKAVRRAGICQHLRTHTVPCCLFSVPLGIFRIYRETLSCTGDCYATNDTLSLKKQDSQLTGEAAGDR